MDASKPAASHRSTPYPVPLRKSEPTPDTVWVDCFFYGFFMEKKKLPAFQASLRQQQAAHQHVKAAQHAAAAH